MQGSAAPAGRSQARERLLTEDLRPERPLGGGGSRFLKKAPPAATSSSLSPVRKGQRQQAPGPRNVPSYQRGSQAAALSKLAQIERRIRKQVQGDARQGPKPAEDLTSDEEISPAARYMEAPVQHSVQSNSDQILRGSRFLKNKTPVTVNTLDAAAGARLPKGADIGVRSRSRAADTVVPLAALETKPVRVASGVSLEGDEEDTRKLLGDTLDSINHLSMSKRPSSIRTADKIVPSSPPPAVVPPSSSLNTAPPGGAASPSCHSSPFRFPGQAQALFSPPVPSPPPSPPCVSSPPPGREGSPQRSLSSFSGREEVLSLEELFLGDPQSETSAVTSEDFKINVMTLDDLGFTENTPGEEREESPNRHQEQQPQSKEKKDELQVEEEDAGLYQSDFDSEPDYSVSEHLRGAGGEPDLEHSNTSRRRTQDDYSSTVSGHSQPLSKSDDSRSSVSHDGRISSRQSRWPNSSRKVLKETAVQTQHDPLAYTWPAGALAPPVRMTYMDPTPVGAYTLSAEMVEALSTSNQAVFALNEMLKQQLAMTRRLMESRHRLHSSLVQSLGPANYRYTTLEDTKEANITQQDIT